MAKKRTPYANQYPDDDGAETKWGNGCCPDCGGVHASWLGRYKNKANVWQSDYKCDDCGGEFSEVDEETP